MPLWITSLQRMSLWFPSICHKALGPWTEYSHLLTSWCHLRAVLNGLVLWIESRSLPLWTYTPRERIIPAIIISPMVGKSAFIDVTRSSRSWLLIWVQWEFKSPSACLLLYTVHPLSKNKGIINLNAKTPTQKLPQLFHCVWISMAPELTTIVGVIGYQQQQILQYNTILG